MRVYGGAGDGGARSADPPARGIAFYAAVGAAVLALVVLVWHSTAAGGGPAGPHSAGAASTAPLEPAPGDEHRSVTGGPSPGAPTGETALLHNPLYSTGRLAPLPCPAPELDIDSSESVEDFLNTVADCLDDTWATQFAKAGLVFEPPGRVFWDEPGVSPCREYPSTAGGFYCRSSKSVYIGTADVVEKWNRSTDSVVYASLLAHEYGHHVQGESGLLEYYHERRRLEPETAQRSAWTRKSELQANCLAGAFLGAVSVTYPIGGAEREVIIEDAAATADRADSTEEERTHGSADNSMLWIEHGMEHQSPGACNTWSADEDVLQ
ncbi:neutral zinc metallopeptidase [Actinorugispora endophytica]|uniref:Metalloprotease n=1 Tax=Actinorugispora endophytica TaxID=1605990 RepID=A0A4R6V7H7_9ACTN|nr:neutral zinc metallopeptidase [Actinorugispora endophytica]TDQ55192.1 hypothetical protein EV190_101517 [Actinorugispora endophytica]